MRARRPLPSAAFTLVEMLVVIVIIAILAAFLLPAVNRVRINALNSRIAVEAKNLERSVEAYREKYGDYPPNFIDRDLVRRHIYSAWPNIEDQEFQLAESVFWTPRGVSPAEAVVFWLGGFSSNPRRPFSGKDGPFVRVQIGPNRFTLAFNPDRAPGVFEFDQSRVKEEDALARPMFRVYTPPGREEPYVYFDSRTYGLAYYWPERRLDPAAVPRRGMGIARPYLSTRPSTTSGFSFEWVNKDKFQIISAGLDGHYGSIDTNPADPLTVPRPQYPTGVNYLSPGDGDDDNITSFSEGRRLQDMKP